MGCPGLSPSILSDTMLSVRSRSSQENGGWCIPTCNFNTLPGTYYLRALTCRPVVWGSVTLVILQSSCIINVIMLLPHKQLANSIIEAQANLSFTLCQIIPLLYRFLAPDRALFLVLISLILPYFIKHQKLCFAYLEECPGLTFNNHIET